MLSKLLSRDHGRAVLAINLSEAILNLSTGATSGALSLLSAYALGCRKYMLFRNRNTAPLLCDVCFSYGNTATNAGLHEPELRDSLDHEIAD